MMTENPFESIMKVWNIFSFTRGRMTKISSTLFIGETFHNLAQEMKTVLDFDGSSITQVNATFNLETCTRF